MKDLTSGNIYKNFILFAIPMVLSGLLSQTYGIIDTALAGRFLGEGGLAAIGATAQIISLISGLFWGFSTGVSIYIARLFGGKEYIKMKTDIINIISVLIVIMIAVSAAAVIFSGKILELINVESAIKWQAQLYFCVYISGLFIIILNNTFSKLLNAMGISGYPFFMSLVAAVIHIFGNILSVTVFRLGVLGFAISSVLAALIVDMLYIFKLSHCFAELGVKKGKRKFSLYSFKVSLIYALPTCLQQTAMYFAGAAMSPIINGVGSSATAGYTIVTRVYDINAGVYQNSATTLGNYTAQCVGARKYGQIRKGLFAGILQGIVFLLPFLLVCCIFAEPVCSVFFSDEGASGEALGYAVSFSRLYLPFIIFNLINNIFHHFFRGMGTMRLLIVSTVIGSAFRIAVSVILAGRLGMDGIFIGMAASWIAEALFVFVVYLLKFNTEDKIRRSVK